MAQYDVFPNPSTHAGSGMPYVVAMQSDLLDALATRLTIPLALAGSAGKVPAALSPIVVVKGEPLRALAHFAAPLPASLLRQPVDNVVAQGFVLVSALDAVLAGV